MDRAEQLAALHDRRIHLGIAPDLGTSLDRRFESRQLVTCPMVAVLPAGHGFGDAAPEIGVEALSNQILLSPSLKRRPAIPKGWLSSLRGG